MKIKFLLILCSCLPLFAFGESLVKNGDFTLKNAKGDFPEFWLKVNAGDAEYVNSMLAFKLRGHLTRIENSLFLKINRKYRLTMEMKTEQFAGNAGVYVTNQRWQGGLSIPIAKGSSNWQTVEKEFVLESPQDSKYRLILYARENGKGTIYFRNIQIQEVIATQSLTPFITAGQVSRPPVIDGVADDDAWRQLPELTPFLKRGQYQFTEFGQEATTAKIGYDQQNLYVFFRNHQRCLEPVRNALDQFKVDVRTHDGDLSKQDCNVVFISPDGGTAMFYEIMANGAGTVTDAECRAPDYWTTGRNPAWESHAVAAAKTADGEWTLELAIPWSSLGINPAVGKKFSICLGRLNQDANEATTFFEMQQGFHRPEYFGAIRLGGKLPGWSDLQIGNLGNGENTLTLKPASPDLSITAAVSEDQRTNRKFTTRTSSMKYRLDAEQFASLQLSFTNRDQVFQVSPVFRINCAKQQLFTDQSKFNFNGQPVTGGKVAAATGHYRVEGLNAPFKLATGSADNLIQFEQTPEALLVNQTIFWPENHGKLHIAENSIQPLFLVASHSDPKLNRLPYTMTVALPEEIKFVGASDFTRNNHQFAGLSTAKAGEQMIGGKKYHLHQIRIPQGLISKPYYQNNDGIAILLQLGTSGKAFATRATKIFYWADFGNGKILEAPESLEVIVYPPLRRLTPKKFITQMWGGSMINLNKPELIETYIRQTLVPGGFNDLQNSHHFAKGTGMTHFCVINFQAFWGKEAVAFAKSDETRRRVSPSGQKIPYDNYNPICPQVIISDPKFHGIIDPAFKRYCANYQYLNFDYESPAATGLVSCYCPRCLEKFRSFAALPADAKLEPATVNSQYRAKWLQFSNQNLADITAAFQKIVHRYGRKLTFYSGYQSERSREQYNVDWRLLGPHIDYAGCGYQAPASTYQETVKALGKTPLVTGVIAAPWHFTSRENGYQIDKAFTIKGIVLGSKGFLCYNAPQLDGRSYHSMSEVAALLAKYEPIMYDGKIDRSYLKIKGIPAENWGLFTHPEHSQKILVIYNDSPAKPLNYTVELPQEMKVAPALEETPEKIQQRFNGTVAPGDYQAYRLKL